MNTICRITILASLCASIGCQTVREPHDSLVANAPEQARELPQHEPHTVAMLKSINASFLFKINSAKLSKEAIETLMPIVARLKEHKSDTVSFVGYTCDLGDPDFNIALGLRRAEAAKSILVSLGVPPERITTSSAGETRPVVPNTSEENRRLNRRVELDVEYGDYPSYHIIY